MTRISFYILANDAGDTDAFLCRLIDKAVQADQNVYVYAPDPAALQRLNERLWTFRDDSFVAHDLLGDEGATAPVILGGDTPPAELCGVLLNLDLNTPQPPEFYSRFDRCLELVPAQEALRPPARQRYKFYKDRGYPVDNFNIAL